MNRLQRCLCDLCFFLVVCSFAWAAQQGTIELSAGGIALTDSDMHNYASFMARKAHPENFTRDFALAEATPAVTYPTVQEWIAARIMPQDQFAVGLISVLGGCLVLFYCGWYVLGIELLGSRRLACLLALGMGVTIYVGWGTFWGITGAGPMARTLYTALVPWLLWTMWRTRVCPWGQAVLMFAAGCLAAVHSVSAVSLGCALSMGLLIFKPAQWGLWRFLAHIVLCFFLFALPAVLFIFTMMPMPHVQLSAADISILQKMFQTRFAEDFGGTPMLWFIQQYSLNVPLLPIGALTAAFIFWRGTAEQRRMAALALLCISGLIILVLIDPLTRAIIASMSNAVPASYELRRAIRFVPMFCLLLTFIALSIGWQHCRRWMKTAIFVLLLPVGIASYAYEPAFLAALYKIAPDAPATQVLMHPVKEKYAADLRHLEAIQAVQQHVRIQELIFSNAGDLAVRHVALRSLDFTFKDGLHAFHNKNAAGARQWMELYAVMQQSPTAYIQLWRDSTAEWLLLDRLQDLPDLEPYGTIVWKNAGYALLRKK